MRPKRRILLIDTDEDRMGVLSYVLAQHGYFTIRTAPGPTAAGAIRCWEPNALVRRWQDGRITLKKPSEAHTETVAADTPNLILLDRIKFFCARKRGPKPGRKPVQGERNGKLSKAEQQMYGCVG